MANATTIVIFGASGDLTQRKLIPALFGLYRKGRLPANLRILGFATRPWVDEEFRLAMRAAVDEFAGYPFSGGEWAEFAARLAYVPGNFSMIRDYTRLADVLADLDGGPADRLYYLAAPPRFYADIVARLGQAGLVAEAEGWRRVVIEKPFGTDLPSARALNQALLQVLDEQQIYRIDHYLGKETVQNILTFRFANTIFEPVWNRNYIDHVQITVAEAVGLEQRAGYYDEIGALRDMFQNHLLQLLSLVAMEPPGSDRGDALRNEKVKALSAVRPIRAERAAEHTVRGQYKSYRQEPGVAPGSQTETYAALRLYIDNWRWQGVPFYLRSGKSLAEKCTEVIIQFKRPPHAALATPAGQEMPANLLALCLQPDEGIHLRFEAKVPDTAADTRPVDMEFHYRDSFGATPIPEAYERLLLDALGGDVALFTRSDRTELAWELIDPIIAGWQAPGVVPLAAYDAGSWGPREADALLQRDGRNWLRACGGHAP
jgi:glucose-6-phosphate 1-dehydrogenase